MDETRRRREERKHKRFRTLKTNDPFCRVCGKHSWWVRYERHHIDGRHIFPDTIMLCLDCHNEVGEMIKDQFPLPADTPADVVANINRLRGLNELAKLMIAWTEQTIDSLLRSGYLPPAPATPPVKPKLATGSVGDDGSAGVIDRLAEMEAKWGDLPGIPGLEVSQ